MFSCRNTQTGECDVGELRLVVPLQLSFQRKVGVMYCMSGQSSEEEMYNNESAGPALEEFLHLLGERVRLKGFSKYRAQLDTKSTCTLREMVQLQEVMS